MVANTSTAKDVEILIDPALLESLGAIWGKEISQISPLAAEGAKADAADIKQLSKAGVCTKTGEIVPEMEGLVGTLAQADTFGRFEIIRSNVTIQLTTYRKGDGEHALIINEDGALRISYPSGSDVVTSLVSEYTGRSALGGCEFEAVMTWKEACAFSALIDLQRRSYLRNIAEELEPVPLSFEKAEILSALVTKGKYQWLASIMRDLHEEEPFADEKELADALKSIASKGFVEQKGNKWNLSMDSALLARQMLITEQIVSVNAGKMYNPDELSTTAFGCLQSGIHGVLMIDPDGDSVTLSSLSPAELVAHMAYILDFGVPQAEFDQSVDTADTADVPEDENSDVGADSAKFCRECGAKLEANTKFCGSCGTKL